MRTLTLLAAILLLAPQAQAQPLPENAEEALEQQQPQQEDQDQDVAISSAGAENSGAQYEGQKAVNSCLCRKRDCRPSETRAGFCTYGHKQRLLCCL